MALLGTNVTPFVLMGIPGLAYHHGVGVFGLNAAIVALGVPLTFWAIGYPAWLAARATNAVIPAELYATPHRRSAPTPPRQHRALYLGLRSRSFTAPGAMMSIILGNVVLLIAWLSPTPWLGVLPVGWGLAAAVLGAWLGSRWGDPAPEGPVEV